MFQVLSRDIDKDIIRYEMKQVKSALEDRQLYLGTVWFAAQFILHCGPLENNSLVKNSYPATRRRGWVVLLNIEQAGVGGDRSGSL